MMTDKIPPYQRGPIEATGTLRKRIIAALEGGFMTVRDLSKRLRASEKEIISHMGHVAKSLHRPKRLIVAPSICDKCRFTFSDRHRFSSPSRCPRCRHERIRPPAFKVERI
ncbi:MAG: transcriptional regulator [Nitrospiria bacterium]